MWTGSSEGRRAWNSSSQQMNTDRNLRLPVYAWALIVVDLVAGALGILGFAAWAVGVLELDPASQSKVAEVHPVVIATGILPTVANTMGAAFAIARSRHSVTAYVLGIALYVVSGVRTLVSVPTAKILPDFVSPVRVGMLVAHVALIFMLRRSARFE